MKPSEETPPEEILPEEILPEEIQVEEIQGREPDGRAAAMACRPVKNAEVGVQPLENGDLLLTYPVAVRPWLERLFNRLGRGPRPPLRRKVQLDALGTQVWGWIDGERSVEELVTVFGERHKVTRREAEISVTAFLRMLGKRGLVGMQPPSQAPGGEG